jgi:hypothetical protein
MMTDVVADSSLGQPPHYRERPVLSPYDPITLSPNKKKQSRPTPRRPRSLTNRFRKHAPQQCKLSRRSRSAPVAAGYPAMPYCPDLASGGSLAFARPLGTVRTLYTDTFGLSRGCFG